MPRLRPDALFLPSISWTEASAPSAVSYGALVGTPNLIILLPRSGAGSAGFTLTLQWTKGGATADDLQRLVADPQAPIGQIEQTLVQSLPQWTTRCVFPRAQLARFEVLSGWKLWLGVSAVVQLHGEGPTSLRIPNKQHLEELRQMYPAG